jgi:transposase
MFGLSAAVRVYLATEPADMRKSFDGLAALASGRLALDPLSGHLFVFVNKRRDRIKILYWDRDELAVWAKRLERRTFRIPAAVGGRVDMTTADRAALLAEIDRSAARRRPRHARPATPLQKSRTDCANTRACVNVAAA